MQEHGGSSWDDLEVYGTIAGGGMATIEYAGKATAAGRVEVVLKRPRPCFARDPEFAAMFLDEARLSIRIAHANVVRTLGVLEEPLALVLEYVAGESLHDLLQLARRAEAKVPTRVASALIVGVLHGLQAAHHTRGEDGAPLSIVHRDVTPGNILIGSDGVARLLDFGIAKAAGKLRLTPCGEFKGKLAYVSPEQLEGAEATHQSDVYSAALVLWETLAGRALFERGHDAMTLEAILSAEVPSLCEQRADVSPELDAIVHKALARDPRERFADAAELARALEHEVGVAGQSSVIDWLEQLAGERLRERSARLQALRAEPRAPGTIAVASTRDVPAANGGGTLVSQPKDTVVVAEPTQLALQRASVPTRLQPSAASPVRARRWSRVASAGCAVLALGAGASLSAPPPESPARTRAALETPIALSDCLSQAEPVTLARPLQLTAAAPPVSAPPIRPTPRTARHSRARALTDFGPRSPLTRSPAWLAEAELRPSLLDTGLGRR